MYRVTHDVDHPGPREQVVITHVVRVTVSVDHVGDVIWPQTLGGQSGDQEILVPGGQRVHYHPRLTLS